MICAEALAEVKQVLSRYAQADDDGRVDEVVGLFAMDATVGVPGLGPARGHKEIRAAYTNLAGAGAGKHIIANVVVTGRGRELYVGSDLLLLGKGTQGWAPRLVGRYRDVLRRESDRWVLEDKRVAFVD